MVLDPSTSGGERRQPGAEVSLWFLEKKQLGVEVPGTFTHQRTNLRNLCWTLDSGGNADNSRWKEPCSTLKST